MTIYLRAKNIAYNKSVITVPAGANVVVNFDNQDPGIPHNFAVYDSSAGGKAVFQGKIITGPATTVYSFTAPPQPGTYQFRCDVHPTQMKGQFVVTPSGTTGSVAGAEGTAASRTAAPITSGVNSSGPNPSRISVPESPIETAVPISTTSPLPPTRVTVDLLAKDISFDKDKITVIAGSQVTINFVNLDRNVPHNFALYTNSDAKIALYQGPIIVGPSQITYTFDAPVDDGTYFFRCDVHPKAMTGQFFVVSSDLLPSEQAGPVRQTMSGMNMPMNLSPLKAANQNQSPGEAGSGMVSVDLYAENIAFNRSTIAVHAGAMVTVNFVNKDSGVPHNFAVYTDSKAETVIFRGKVIVGPDKIAYTFTAPAKPGTYFFRCDVHPTQMTGQFIVE